MWTLRYLKLKLLILLLCAAFIANAQDSAVVKGIVKSKSGRVLNMVSVILNGEQVTSTNVKGFYSLKVPSNRMVKLSYYLVTYKAESRSVQLKSGENKWINISLESISHGTDTTVIRKRKIDHEDDGGITLSPIAFKTLPNPSGNFETLIKSQIGVSSSNELSAQYNVRGGSFDENLTYVNGFEIYRPQLVHSGQQEGLSFIHPDFVKNVKFFAGGFSSEYGDKMSSALDVEYKRPKKFGLSVSGGLLGGSAALETRKKRFSSLFGVRYRTSRFLLNSLDVKGQYNPRFLDAQTLLRYRLNEDWSINYLGHIADNQYLSNPESRETSFGTVQSAIRLFVAMDGQEILRYTTLMSGLSLRYDPHYRLKLDFNTSAFYSLETEHNDVLGAYRLGQLDNNLGSDDFGENVGSLGNGFFINHARNDLDIIIYNFQHKGEYKLKKWNSTVKWGAKMQFEDIEDRFLEWKYSDSSDYNINAIGYSEDSIILSEYERSSINLKSQRMMGYAQMNTKLSDSTNAKITYGLRANHWSLNDETVISPRVHFSIEPNRKHNRRVPDSLKRKDLALRFSFGYYYQPAFYRELRDPQGQINKDLKAQLAVHYVASADWLFKAWGRDFKFLTEFYYKSLENIVPFYYDNIRVRYLAENSGKGFAAGWDTRINGEFIKGLESWVTVSFLKTSEKIDYIDKDGNEVNSGYLRRPTDRRMNVAIMFQDELDKDESFRMHLNLHFGTGLPYFLGGEDRYKEGNRIPEYRRVDVGFTKVLKEPGMKSKTNFGKKVRSAYLSVEVFNLLAINNVVSYLWVKDINNNVYGVPNFLTNRLLNAKFTMRF
jgi:hypothetical protein